MKIMDTGITRQPFIPPRRLIKKNTFFSQKAQAAHDEKKQRTREMHKLFGYFMEVTKEGTTVPRSLLEIRQFSPKYKGEKGKERILKFEWERFHDQYRQVHGRYFDGRGEFTTLQMSPQRRKEAGRVNSSIGSAGADSKSSATGRGN
jgi:hypothetical protein